MVQVTSTRGKIFVQCKEDGTPFVKVGRGRKWHRIYFTWGSKGVAVGGLHQRGNVFDNQCRLENLRYALKLAGAAQRWLDDVERFIGIRDSNRSEQ